MLNFLWLYQSDKMISWKTGTPARKNFELSKSVSGIFALVC